MLDDKKKERPKIDKEAKKYLLAYLQAWSDHLSRFSFSYRKGIVRAIYNEIDAMDVIEERETK